MALVVVGDLARIPLALSVIGKKSGQETKRSAEAG
jgi:hypothetical protein